MKSESFGESLPEEEVDPLKDMFQSQEAEVTMEIDGKKEAGWVVEGPDLTKERGEAVIVRKGNKMKSVGVEELASLQEFYAGAIVPVMRSPKEKGGKQWVDSGWRISKAAGYGMYEVEKTIDGERKIKPLVRKTQLIQAQIERAKSSKNDEEQRFWEEKLEATKKAEKDHLEELKKIEKKRAEEADDGDIVGHTPEE